MHKTKCGGGCYLEYQVNSSLAHGAVALALLCVGVFDRQVAFYAAALAGLVDPQRCARSVAAVLFHPQSPSASEQQEQQGDK